MNEGLDFKTLMVVAMMVRLLQSGGLLYVWHLHRNYPPARLWAAGSAIGATGMLLLATSDLAADSRSAMFGMAAIFAGVLIFNIGVLRASSVVVSWRKGLAAYVVATIAVSWFTLAQPSVLAHLAIFAATMSLFDGYAAVKIWRAPRGPLLGIQRFVASLLLVEAATTVLRFTISVNSGPPNPALPASGYETASAFLMICVTVMIGLALAFMTNIIDISERKIFEAALNKTTRLLRSVLDSATDVAIIATGLDLKIIVFNSGAEQLLGYQAAEVINLHSPAIFADPQEVIARGTELSARFGRPIKGPAIVLDEAVLDQGHRWNLIRSDGRHVPVSMTVSAMRADDGKVVGYLGIAHGIAAQIAYENALQREIAKSAEVGQVLDCALSNMKQGLAMYDAEQRLIVCNDNYMAPYGLAKDAALPGTHLADIIRMRIAKGFFSAGGPEQYLENCLRIGAEMLQQDFAGLSRLNDGRTMRLLSRRLETGGWVVTSEDVTELKRAEDKLAYFAKHDVLTGLANRAQFAEKVNSAALELAQSGQSFQVMMLDLDRFKKINDTYGHAAGDAMLVEVANRLRGAVRDADIVARLGGDEFAIIQTAPRPADDATAVANPRGQAIALATRILGALSTPIDLGERTVMAGTSIGVAFAPADGVEADELLRKADFALYAAKASGRNTYRIFEPDMTAAGDEDNRLEAEMRLGLDREEFLVHYQPIVNAATRRTTGFEALVRWNHPRLGLLTPDRFIALAEKTGVIVTLGERVCRRACQDAMAWPVDITVAINLSVVQLKKGGLLDVILSALADSGLPPHRLEVEITESVLLGEDPHSIEMFRQLQNIGVTVALDDFGTGYSSLTYLNRIKFDKLKIDRSFTRDVVGNSDSMAIVTAVCGLARGLNTVSTAEGVETEDQFAMLRAAGISLAQGYLFGKPRPAAELIINDATAAIEGRVRTRRRAR